MSTFLYTYDIVNSDVILRLFLPSCKDINTVQWNNNHCLVHLDKGDNKMCPKNNYKKGYI